MIYGMKLHQAKQLSTDDSLKIVRVAGGWLYVVKYFNRVTSTFVPWSPEFLGHKEKL